MPDVPLECIVAPSEDKKWAVEINNKSFSWGVKYLDEKELKEKK